ncbi:hypothetical protein LMH87_000796 [Akanthomyces muscarius]|uniref:Uncharacterized protein n=1 Tax=Akanthomyces muscarius TaxID=2231603 RepID=A0A9W8UMW8_AKAMU|nr:hypothetical protein LMH87_000796 [Akanthomyces muscarius]KAJ4155557.1 hypothetical protein LMH87_000796 [Akanthomyces muscarius]
MLRQKSPAVAFCGVFTCTTVSAIMPRSAAQKTYFASTATPCHPSSFSQESNNHPLASVSIPEPIKKKPDPKVWMSADGSNIRLIVELLDGAAQLGLRNASGAWRSVTRMLVSAAAAAANQPLTTRKFSAPPIRLDFENGSSSAAKRRE